jgi:apolipoprotein N-acyltransferase
MGRRSAASKPKAGKAQPPKALPFLMRWWGKALLLLLSIALLTFSYAPFKQFYLAWVALVPWLIVVRHCRSARTAFFWSWLAGLAFFTANMWWLVYVTGPGLIALMAVLALYWGASGAIIYATGLLEPKPGDAGGNAETQVCAGRAVASVFLVAMVWTALEWLRGTWPLGGLAWQYLGHSQSPALHLCQIADVTGVFGISFWLILVNAVVALLILHWSAARSLIPAVIAVLVVLGVVLGYGTFRVSQNTTHPGPTVLVVQPNYPQSNSGDKGADPLEIVDLHLRLTEQALAQHPNVNLVVWSETMMPALNPAARQFTGTLPSKYWAEQSNLMSQTNERLARLARQYHTSLLTGGMYLGDWALKTMKGGTFAVPEDRRNTAYYYTPQGPTDQQYDKIHLVPFGEYLPFKSTIPPLYTLFLSLSPYTEEYTLTAGSSDALTVFQLGPDWRFVTPICFEDMDGDLVHRMFKPPDGGRKRADFIVNITNDGWFRYNEMPYHLQAAIFRSIENRAPMSRSVNTGISGFVDSVGRTHDLIPPGRIGSSVATLALDSRITFYTRFGDVFAYACAAVTAVLIPVGLLRGWKRRRDRRSM